MTVGDAKVWRVTRPKFGDGIGLHRVAAVAEAAGLDLTQWRGRAINITGSSGKGSVAAMLARALREGGQSVGLFTSPHLLRLNERFSINGADVDDVALCQAWSRIDAAAAAYEAAHIGDRLGGFEFLYLVGCALFEAARVDWVVMECGIGGRYDPTRVHGARRGALVSLALEHEALLGPSLEQIAYNKLDAVSPGGAIYLGESCLPLRERIEAYCAMTDVAPLFLEPFRDWRSEDGRLVLSFPDGRDVAARPALAGAHQHNNAALAARLAEDVLRLVGLDVAARDGAIRAGIETVVWPGRLERICVDPLIIIDVGHTPEAAQAAREGFFAMTPPGPALLVCGASEDKKAASILAALAPGFDAAITVAARHKGIAADAAARLLRGAGAGLAVSPADTMAQAHERALAWARASGGRVLVAGGLFVAAEFKATHSGLDPAAIAFF